MVLQGQQLKDVLQVGRHSGHLRVVDRVAEPLSEVRVGGRCPDQTRADVVDTLGLRLGLHLEHSVGVGHGRGPLAAFTNLGRKVK